MPIYEYTCDDCGADFELLIRGSETPRCKACESEAVTRRLSLPRVHSDASRARSIASARVRDKKLGTDRMHERVEYESSHDD